MTRSAHHHVNLSVPEDGVETMRGWLVEMLGYREVESGPDLNAIVAPLGVRAWWFEAADGSQVHLSPNPDHAVVARAHTAIRVDDLDDLLARLDAAGFAPTLDQVFDGDRHVFVNDPAGNAWELVGALEEADPEPAGLLGRSRDEAADLGTRASS